jgi:hypothetical protein
MEARCGNASGSTPPKCGRFSAFRRGLPSDHLAREAMRPPHTCAFPRGRARVCDHRTNRRYARGCATTAHLCCIGGIDLQTTSEPRARAREGVRPPHRGVCDHRTPDKTFNPYKKPLLYVRRYLVPLRVRQTAHGGTATASTLRFASWVRQRRYGNGGTATTGAHSQDRKACRRQRQRLT